MKTKKINLEAEELYGYKVSKKMKKVWQIELDELSELDRICKKYKLKYILIDGSLLGAIRHNGFIPWDDDIDVGMMREDYEKLLEVAEKEFKKPYFLQTPCNDDIYRGHAQLRNSNTTAIQLTDFRRSANQGIFLDIFPFDKLPDSNFKYKTTGLRAGICKKLLRCKRRGADKSIKEKTTRLVANIFFAFINYEKFYRHYEKICSKYNNSSSKYCSYLEHRWDGRKVKLEYFKDITTHKFEYFDAPVPKKYKEFLDDYFGDWQVFKKGGSAHGDVFFDPDNSYTKYQNTSIEELKKKA